MSQLRSIFSPEALIRILSAVYIAFILFVLGFYYAHHNGIIEQIGGQHFGRDFINYWTGGKAVLEGTVADIYNRGTYSERLWKGFDRQIPQLNFDSYAYSYPPHLLLFLGPLGAMPYIPALITWLLGSMVALYLAVKSNIGPKLIPLVVLAPAGVICLWGGQNGFITAALLVGGLLLMNKRPRLAGLLFGILTIKPQLGVLLVIALLCLRKWETIIVAGVTTITLFALSALAFGPELWVTYLHDVIPYQQSLLDKSIGLFDYMVPSAYKTAINFGASIQAAQFVQLPFALGGIILTIWAFKSDADDHLRISLLCVLTALFSPYMVLYDLVILSVAVVLTGQYLHRSSQLGWKNTLFLILLFSLPFTHFAAATAGYSFWGTFWLTMFAGFLVYHIHRDRRTKAL